MTGLLIVIAAVALLVAALSPAHRRARTPFRPGADMSRDRDHQRLLEDLSAAEQRQVRGYRRIARLLGSAGSAAPFHRAAPRLSAR